MRRIHGSAEPIPDLYTDVCRLLRLRKRDVAILGILALYYRTTRQGRHDKQVLSIGDFQDIIVGFRGIGAGERPVVSIRPGLRDVNRTWRVRKRLGGRPRLQRDL